MKLDCRTAVLLSLAMTAGHWRGAGSIVLPQQWHPGNWADNETSVANPFTAAADVPRSRETPRGRHEQTVRLSLDAKQPSVRAMRNTSTEKLMLLETNEATNTGKVKQLLKSTRDLLQKRADRFLGGAGLKRVEDDGDMIYGVPKAVWVVIAVALAVAGWIGTVAGVLYFAKRAGGPGLNQGNGPPPEIDWEQIRVAMPRSENPDSQSFNQTPTFMGGIPNGPDLKPQQQPYSYDPGSGLYNPTASYAPPAAYQN